ncbi:MULTISPECIES: AraC family ligand binding domain-containing protein [unclassified Campylobacter]|uniref:AraC family ligand binding domain-containing protein n=1 Tax=unclassified Campylobacter TaxID=2593542 RepID=UPI001237EA12|nr:MULTISPECIES: AraC family ligand binding domain-containing protein [unclassified Campylobacter]KAA6226427.1 cupin domain-containing protein [Campylobacter sp. LR286c]KAA6226535.1 cupin domain-containing protein [Campylobacter sp. LR185c]KAA6226915.1 cupin domain-containing protein [Campylobacter sp. LR196d]KAA6233659.1 cupin domain-containing protein [Campylobacter sp. LR291e]KAA6233879.1 cupin domain-containing protein [Campylobacter sp. LR264d]
MIVPFLKAEFIENKVNINCLVDDEFGKEIQIIFGKNAFMKEHKAPFAVRIQVLKGEIKFTLNNETMILKELDLISLAPNITHSLLALNNSIVRLSLSKFDKIQRISAVLKN